MTFIPLVPGWLLTAGILVLLCLAVLAGLGGWKRSATDHGERRSQLLHVGSGVLTVLLLALAAARPGLPGAGQQAQTNDLNVFFVVDTTSSVAAEDYDGAKPRLEGIQKDILGIAEQLSGARYSMITFDSRARLKLPLTVDGAALETSVELLSPQDSLFAKGTSVTVASELLSERLKKAHEQHPERANVVFYLGDGEQTSTGKAGPMKVDQALVQGGAVLGYGTEQGGRMKQYLSYDSSPPQRYIKDLSGDTPGDAVSKIDPAKLKSIASDLGVPYVHRSAGDPVSQALAGTHATGDSGSSDSGLRGRAELYWIPAGLAALLGLAYVWSLTRSGQRLRKALGSAPERKTL
ncbi:VWA domain-containing protein [Pseudarthrobacter sp. J1738]|uniref:VWA domain-containing protein n=1 Tax=Pseudarthrobacter sp. J1738 TaxID=3420446 RepID=UPI003D27DA7D